MRGAEVGRLRRELEQARSRVMLRWLKDHPMPGVYFVSDGALVKIGIAGNIESRFRQLRTANGRWIYLLAVKEETHPQIVSRRQLEKILHHRFDHLRAEGEWFWPGEDLMDYIAGLPHPGWD